MKMRSVCRFFIGASLVAVGVMVSCCKSSDVTPAKASDTTFVRLLKTETMHSDLLKNSLAYAVLLPAGYDKSSDRYPVVYLLHGYGDDETAWYKYGNIQYYADRYAGDTPMIYVMPRAGNRYYVNKYTGYYPFMDMLVEELVPTIDSIYRTKADKSQRAVMGYSMGGYGALILPSVHPEVFSISIPLSMSFRTDAQYETESQDAYDQQWSPNYGAIGATGEDRLTDYFKSLSPFHYFVTNPSSDYAGLKIFMDCGDDEEQLQHTNDALHDVMRTQGIPHEYRVRNGAHTWDYWKAALPEAFAFIIDAVHGLEYPANPEPVDPGALLTAGQYSSIAVDGGPTVKVVTPPDYANTSTTYPTIYFVYDENNGNDVELLSYISNAMAASRLNKLIAVAIPASSVSTESMTAIIAAVESNFRSTAVAGSRTLMGNKAGGMVAAQLAVTMANSFTSCFLFNASLDDVTEISASTFYYLDATTNTQAFTGYHNMFVAIRNVDGPYEYRVRAGDDSWQSVLNGLDQSRTYINQHLNK